MAQTKKGKKQLNRSRLGNTGVYIILTILGLFMLLPMIYTVSSSLKPLDELWVFPPRFLVRNPTGENFKELFRVLSGSVVPFSRYLFNTALISVVGTAGHVILASMCAYALAKHRFPGSNLMFQVIVITLLFNATVTRIPNFMIMTWLHLLDNYASLILPAFGSTLGLYLMKQFMEQMLNDSLLEAARMDGAGEWRIFSRIAMPMVKPAWLTLIIFSFRDLWNIGGTTYIHTEELKTLNYAMSQILAGGIARAGVGGAAAVVMMIVPVSVFILTQSNVVETMGASGMKE
ncbi:ABC-type glycerol-3-phosphate transport system permease component [Anaerotaenia torta]|uniref:carbohydrate ABC transporter permease n=1 Tax=Anaerotaenia torta TaxID=433293 RepID=UPI003D22EFFE